MAISESFVKEVEGLWTELTKLYVHKPKITSSHDGKNLLLGCNVERTESDGLTRLHEFLGSGNQDMSINPHFERKGDGVTYRVNLSQPEEDIRNYMNGNVVLTHCNRFEQRTTNLLTIALQNGIGSDDAALVLNQLADATRYMDHAGWDQAKTTVLAQHISNPELFAFTDAMTTNLEAANRRIDNPTMLAETLEYMSAQIPQASAGAADQGWAQRSLKRIVDESGKKGGAKR